SIQEARAIEHGRGRRAAAPHAIPWNGWKDILKRTFNKIFDDRILALAAGVLDIVRDEITRIAAKSDGRLTLGFLLSLGIAVWSANAGMKALFDALNVIYDEREKRGLIRLNAISLMFTIGA